MTGWVLWAAAGWAPEAAAMPGVGTEVSHARGKKDGVVVLWPRVVPETTDPLVNQVASSVQQAVATTVSALVPAERTSVRPSPERVCPRDGCRAVSVTVMVGHQAGGCAAVALIGPPGPEAQRLVPLAGAIDLAGAGVPYRDRPEDHLVVREFVPCAELTGQLDTETLQRALADAGLGGL